MDDLFSTYSSLLEGVSAWVEGEFPRGADESAAAHTRAVRAKALDLVRGLLPAASLSHMGMYASGQTYEQLVLHLLAHPLAEARAYGAMLLEELQKIIPSFVTRVPREDRGGRWIEYLRERRNAADAIAARLGLDEETAAAAPSVRLLRAHGTEEELLAALLYESTATGEEDALRAVFLLDPAERVALLRELIGDAREPEAPARAAASRRSRTASRSSRTTARSATCSDTGCSRASGSGSRPISVRTSRTRSSPQGSAASTSARSRSHATSTRGCAARGSSRRRPTRSALPSASATSSSSTPAPPCT